MDISMSRAAREEFLAEARVGVLAVADDRNAGAPLQVPLWYSFEPGGDPGGEPRGQLTGEPGGEPRGEVVVLTPRSSLKAELIRRCGRFGLCSQDEAPPYRYVSVEGPVVAVEEGVDRGEWEAMARRYLAPAAAASYLAANEAQLDDHMTFRMRPEKWRAADFSAFAAEFS